MNMTLTSPLVLKYTITSLKFSFNRQTPPLVVTPLIFSINIFLLEFSINSYWGHTSVVESIQETKIKFKYEYQIKHTTKVFQTLKNYSFFFSKKS